MTKIKNIKKELLSENYFKLNKYLFDFQLLNGKWIRPMREVFDNGNGSAILLFNKEKSTVILTKQFRMATYINGNDDGFMIEVCAGLLDGDNPESRNIKETEEETGYKLKNITKVMEAFSTPGAVTEKVYYFVAEYTEDMKVGEGGGLESENEDIEVLEIKFSKAIEMINTGEIQDAKSIILLQYAQINNLLM